MLLNICVVRVLVDRGSTDMGGQSRYLYLLTVTMLPMLLKKNKTFDGPKLEVPSVFLKNVTLIGMAGYWLKMFSIPVLIQCPSLGEQHRNNTVFSKI